MDKYVKVIGFKTIYLTLVRRFHIILMIFIPFTLASFIVTNFVFKKTYQSTVTVASNAAIATADYQVLQTYVKQVGTTDKPGTLNTVVSNLEEKGIKHANGNKITIDEISSGISFNALTSSTIFVSFTFQTTEQAIAKPVLDEVAKVAVDNFKASASKYSSFYVSGEATNGVKNSKETTYFLIALAVGFVVACAVPFVYEIIADEVYDKEDVEMLGSESFELKVSK